MSEDKKNKEQDSAAIDLSGLSNLEFATAWTPSSTSDKFLAPRKDSKRGPEKRPFNANKKRSETFRGDNTERMRRPFKNSSKDDYQEKAFKKFKGAKSGGKKFNRQKTPFNPTMEVLFYPDDAPFNKLVDIMKASKRTYQLFDIAQLVLEKPERFIVLAKNLPDSEGNTKPLYCAQPLNLPFEDEISAKNAAVEYYFNELFSMEKIEAEAPKGNFQVVNKSTVTGELLGAPNWHKYNEHLREYYRQKSPKMSFDAFAAAVESVRDPEQISAWLESMKTRDVYKLKTPPAEGEADTFDTYEAAVNYIIHKMGADLVKTYEQVRMKGSNIAKLPFGRIRRNIEETCRRQRHFPIVTANNLRGRLRRSGFTVYKRGSKGFAFVSVVKRKFLFEGDSLSEMPQAIFNFITQNPGISANDLPYKFLGLTPPSDDKQGDTLSEDAKPAISEEIQGTVSDKEESATAEATKPNPNSNEAENAEAQQISEGSKAEELNPAPVDAPESASIGGDAPQHSNDAEKSKLSSVLSEMFWLISEGYVVEYADTTLQANPYLPRPKDKSQAPQEDNIGTIDEPIVGESKDSESESKEGAEAPDIAEANAPDIAEAEAPDAQDEEISEANEELSQAQAGTSGDCEEASKSGNSPAAPSE